MLANRWTLPRSLPISDMWVDKRWGEGQKQWPEPCGRQRNPLKHKRDDNNV